MAIGGDRPTELRRLAADGAVEETLTVKDVAMIAGMERTRDDSFYCAGENGKLRLVRRKRIA